MTQRDINSVACIGEVMIELIASADGTAELNVAGDTYNTAAYLKRLRPELTVDYVTVLGRDGFSDRIVQHMEAHGIGTDAVARDETRVPGLYAIETDESGERSFTYWRSDSAARTLFGEDGRDPYAVLSDYDLVLISGISLAILSQQQRNALGAAVDRFRADGGLLAFDSNYRPHLWNDAELARAETTVFWNRTDIALPSVDDEMNLYEDAEEAEVLARFGKYKPGTGVLKCGEAGPIDLTNGQRVQGLERATSVLDTTAAGDSFNAGFLAGFVAGTSAAEAIGLGHALALQVISKRGAIVETDPL